jgi:hypothetical protein
VFSCGGTEAMEKAKWQSAWMAMEGYSIFKANILILADEAMKLVKNTLAILSFKTGFDAIVEL